LSRLLCSSVVPKKLHFTSCWTRTCSFLALCSAADLASSYFAAMEPPKWCVPVCRIKHTATPPAAHAHRPPPPCTHVRTQIQLETWFVGSTCLLTFNFISLLLRWFLSATIPRLNPFSWPSRVGLAVCKVFGQLAAAPLCFPRPEERILILQKVGATGGSRKRLNLILLDFYASSSEQALALSVCLNVV